MAKYIDAERAERNGWYLHRTVVYSTAVTGGYGYTETLKPTDYPAADVVEVVRCGECKWFRNRFDQHYCCLAAIDCPLPDDYCSRGERKEVTE